MYSCPLCSGFLGHSFKKLLSHIKFIHSHEANFSITCGNCGRSFRKFASFKTHIRREQEKTEQGERTVLEEEVADEYNNDELSDFEPDYDEEQEVGDHISDITKFLALFILKTKEENQLSQQAMDAILGNTEDVVESSLQCLKDKIRTCLANNDICIGDVHGLSEVLSEPSIFSRAKEPLGNEYLQAKYFMQNFHLVVRTWCNNNNNNNNNNK